MELPAGYPPLPVGIIPHLSEEAKLVCPLTATFEIGAQQHGFQSADEFLLYCLFYPMYITADFGKGEKGWRDRVKYLPSRHFGSGAPGPRQEYPVMVVGRACGQDDYNNDKVFAGGSGAVFKEVCDAVGVNANDWYVTNLLRFYSPSGKYESKHAKDCMCLLAQDIAIVKPKYLLLMGADAVNNVLDTTLAKSRSQPLIISGIRNLKKLPRLLQSASLVELEHGAISALCTIAPGAVIQEAGYRPGFERDIQIFASMVDGTISKMLNPGEGCDYRYITTPAALTATINEILSSNHRELSVDCEWGGDFMQGKLRSIQFSWKEGSAAVVIFLHAGEVAAQTHVEYIRLLDELRRLFTTPDIMVDGHNLRADAKWFHALSIPIMDRFAFDTMLADHVLNENAEHGLEACAVRFTNMGRYDYPVQKWLSDNGYDKKKLEERGYLDVPNELLYLYAACDVDCGRRIKAKLMEQLNRPENASLRNFFFDVVMPCNWPLHEIEVTGLLVDRELMTKMVWAYDNKKNELLHQIRMMLKQPDFNPRSQPQVSALLFGPPDKNGFGLTPYKTTGKPSFMWEDLGHLTEEERSRKTPSTDAETLENLAAANPVCSKLRDFKLLDQVAKSFLRLPDGEDLDDYTTGLVGTIDRDGRIRTNLSQMSETGRQKSSNPNLQNLPKKQEKEFERLMGDSVPSIRSAFIAKEGNVIIEVDYKSAEVFTMGYLSNELQLVKDAESDLHARGAVTYFNLPAWPGFNEGASPPDEWKEHYKAERVAAKTINFGIPYQRGAKAVARQIVKETKGKLQCTTEHAQNLINGFYEKYPGMRDYVDMCKWCVANEPHYLANPYGRRRRFYGHAERAMMAAQEREAVNFPIQSTVADTLNVALYNFYYWRRMWPGRAAYSILLAVHDAVLLEVPVEHIDVVINEVIPQCMTLGARVPSWTPVPNRHPTKHFTLDTDIGLCLRWDKKAKAEELRARHVPDKWINKFAAKEKKGAAK